MDDFWNEIKTWYSKPFAAVNMTATDWFLFLGLLTIISLLWAMILRHITSGVE